MKTGIFIFEGIVQAFIGIGAVIYGPLLIIDPSGGKAAMPVELLSGSPFSNYLIPGILLFLINGVGHIAGVKLSNPDKVLFPDQGVSKRALANFYVEIADFILPHLVQRPLSLLRCPDGRQKECFYQKHFDESKPDALRSISIKEKEKTENYVMIDDQQGLISLVQLGVLEIHPWGSSEENIERPDILTFDLDPGPDVRWSDIRNAAKLLHERLQELGLESFVKTSGGKGLHVVIPIERRTDWDTSKAFTKAIAQDLVRQQPDKFVATMSKSKRSGKIFIDYLRNSRGATSVAAYSTRAKQGAPVSTPIRWDELSGDIKADAYTIENLPQRLSSLRSDPWEDYFEVRQSITKSMRKELGMKD